MRIGRIINRVLRPAGFHLSRIPGSASYSATAQPPRPTSAENGSGDSSPHGDAIDALSASGFVQQIMERLDRLERLSHGGRATFVGNNRVLTRIAIGDIVLGFLVEADDRLLVPNLIVHGDYEPPLTKYFLGAVTNQSHCLDVGANFGYFTCLFARLALAGRTIGIEPDEQIFALLRDNIYINFIQASGSAMHAAVSDGPGQLTLHRRGTRSGNTSVIFLNDEHLRSYGEAASQPFKVEALAVDDLLPRFEGRLDFLKIDVEGAEPLVIRGMRRTIATNPHIKIVMEWSPGQIVAAGFDIDDFIRELVDLRLDAAVLGSWGPEPIALPDLARIDYCSGVLFSVKPYAN